MIDKHRPTKLGVNGLLRGTILCWFHIMQCFGENLKNWNINKLLRYEYLILIEILYYINILFNKYYFILDILLY